MRTDQEGRQRLPTVATCQIDYLVTYKKKTLED